MRQNILILAHSPGMQFIESCNQYVQLFNKDQYEVTVAYLVDADSAAIRQKNQAEHVIFLNCSRAEIRGLKISAIRKLLALCHEKQFSQVICHRYKPIYLMLWVAQFCPIPKLIFVMHAIGTMRAIPRKLLVAGLLQKNMWFAGVSNAVRDDLRRSLWRVPPERILTLHNIIDSDYYEPRLLTRLAARDALKIDENDFVFGHIGRLVKEKDQKNLITAFAKIHERCQTAKLVIIGDGRLEGPLKQQVTALGLEQHIHFAGFIPDGYLLMKAFDALVLCSIKEGFGRVTLEAMLARIPVIATEVFGIPDVVGDAGFLVAASNSDALAAAMLTVYELPLAERKAWGEKGYQRMLQHFTIEPFKKTFWQIPA